MALSGGAGEVLAVLQARTSSTRLPGKVLADLLGKPMLARQIERLGRCRRLDTLLVATSTAPEDDAVASLAAEAGVGCARGSLSDVLDRYWQAASPRMPAQVVRVTGDCPLADPAVIDLVIERHLAEANDYTSNTLVPTWPDGLDVEVLTLDTLRRCWELAESPAEREHVTLFAKRHPERFKLGDVRARTDHGGLRWTVDEPEDLAFVRAVYQALYPGNPAFDSNDIHALLARRPQLASLNTHHERDAGLKRSLQAERTQPS